MSRRGLPPLRALTAFEAAARLGSFRLAAEELGITQKNPEALQKMSPVSRKIYQARLEHLQNQVQQLENAQIGRQVGSPALAEGQSPAGGGPAGGGISEAAGL